MRRYRCPLLKPHLASGTNPKEAVKLMEEDHLLARLVPSVPNSFCREVIQRFNRSCLRRAFDICPSDACAPQTILPFFKGSVSASSSIFGSILPTSLRGTHNCQLLKETPDVTSASVTPFSPEDAHFRSFFCTKHRLRPQSLCTPALRT